MTLTERIKVIILLLVLSLISFIVILINGRTYELRIKIDDNIKSISDVKITTGDKNVIKIVDKKLNDNVLILKLKSVNKGHDFIEVLSKKHFSIDRFYVHGLGIMTYNRILGKCSGDIVVPISILILILAVLFIELKHYIKSVRNNFYQYKNITYLALIIFLTFMFVNYLLMIIRMSDYMGPTAWVIYPLCMGASIGLVGFYVVSRFVKNPVVTRLAGLFAAIFVLALIADLLFDAQGDQNTFGNIGVVSLLVSFIFAFLLFNSLSKEKAE